MKPLLASKRRSARQISWEQILANLDDGVIALNVEQKVIFFNEASEVLTDISSGAAVGQALEQIFKREPWLIELVKTDGPVITVAAPFGSPRVREYMAEHGVTHAMIALLVFMFARRMQVIRLRLGR